MMYKKCFLIILCLAIAGCSKPLVDGKVAKNVRFASETYNTDIKTAYYAARWALKNHSYPIAKENMKDGELWTSWVPTTSDSHGISIFNRRDLGVNGAYYRINVNIVSVEKKVRVDVGSEIKSVAAGVKSTGIEERRILREIKGYLRVREPEVTNIGIEE